MPALALPAAGSPGERSTASVPGGPSVSTPGGAGQALCPSSSSAALVLGWPVPALASSSPLQGSCVWCRHNETRLQGKVSLGTLASVGGGWQPCPPKCELFPPGDTRTPAEAASTGQGHQESQLGWEAESHPVLSAPATGVGDPEDPESGDQAQLPSTVVMCSGGGRGESPIPSLFCRGS